METVIVAFEGEKSSSHVRDVLESAGVAACLVCRSAAEVKRAVNQQNVSVVVCGYKFPDQSAEELFHDLPLNCSMLLLANASLLDLCASREIVKLTAPVPRGELVAAVEQLLERDRRMERFIRPRRSREETELIRDAKAALMDGRGMTEEEAHRYLQKRSMDRGLKLSEAARNILAES